MTKKEMDKHPQFKTEGASYGITRGSGKPSGAMAAFVKKDKNLVVDKNRIDEGITKVSSFGKSCGLSEHFSVPLWKTLIDLSIEHEYQEIEKMNAIN